MNGGGGAKGKGVLLYFVVLDWRFLVMVVVVVFAIVFVFLKKKTIAACWVRFGSVRYRYVAAEK